MRLTNMAWPDLVSTRNNSGSEHWKWAKAPVSLGVTSGDVTEYVIKLSSQEDAVHETCPDTRCSEEGT